MNRKLLSLLTAAAPALSCAACTNHSGNEIQITLSDEIVTCSDSDAEYTGASQFRFTVAEAEINETQPQKHRCSVLHRCF